MLDANIYHVVALVKKSLEVLTKRENKQFGLITVSSGTAHYPVPNATTYSSTKAFVNLLTLGIQ